VAAVLDLPYVPQEPHNNSIGRGRYRDEYKQAKDPALKRAIAQSFAMDPFDMNEAQATKYLEEGASEMPPVFRDLRPNALVLLMKLWVCLPKEVRHDLSYGSIMVEGEGNMSLTNNERELLLSYLGLPYQNLGEVTTQEEVDTEAQKVQELFDRLKQEAEKL
jgi:hypothetical protein